MLASIGLDRTTSARLRLVSSRIGRIGCVGQRRFGLGFVGSVWYVRFRICQFNSSSGGQTVRERTGRPGDSDVVRGQTVRERTGRPGDSDVVRYFHSIL